MKRIFVVSWFFPPLNSSEAVLAWKLLSHSRFQYDVFTQKRSEAWSYGPSAELPDAPNLRRFYAGSGELSRFAAEALRFFLRHRADYDLLMTRSMPPECHLAGLWIKQRCPELRWIASFGDPVFRNPYDILGGLYDPCSLQNPLNRQRRLLFRLSPLRLLRLPLWEARHWRSFLLRRRLARIERQTLRKADRLLFNNPSQLRYMTGLPAEDGRALLVPHSCDAALYPASPLREGGARLRFVYLGQLNTVRSPRPLLEALARLKRELPELAARAAFVFYGDMADADLAYILRQGLGDAVTIRGPVSYRESLAAAAGADWLLHIDADLTDVTEENVFFAGKLADYFGAGRPILAVTMAKGAAADCLRRAGALVTSFSPNEIKQALYQIIARGLTVDMDRAFLRRYASSEAAAILDERAVRELL